MPTLNEVLNIFPHVSEKRVKEYISSTKNINVNWQKLHNDLSKNYDEDFVNDLNKILRNLDVLSPKAEGNYILVSDHSILNPISSPVPGTLYFTRREDAEEYSRTFYKKLPYKDTLIFQGTSPSN